MKAALLLCAAALAAPTLPARACGACVEDKVAATYDFQVISRAAAHGEVVVFCEVDGALDRTALRQAARRVRGVRADSVRISAAPAALSFALDPARQSPQAAVAAAQLGLPAGTHLTIVRLMQAAKPADSGQDRAKAR